MKSFAITLSQWDVASLLLHKVKAVEGSLSGGGKDTAGEPYYTWVARCEAESGDFIEVKCKAGDSAIISFSVHSWSVQFGSQETLAVGYGTCMSAGWITDIGELKSLFKQALLSDKWFPKWEKSYKSYQTEVRKRDSLRRLYE
jgi:hypothetical protein